MFQKTKNIDSAFRHIKGSGAGMVANSFGNAKSTVACSMSPNCVIGGYFIDKKDDGSYMKDKLSGKT